MYNHKVDDVKPLLQNTKCHYYTLTKYHFDGEKNEFFLKFIHYGV